MVKITIRARPEPEENKNLHFALDNTNCQARLLLISAQISNFHSQSLNSETEGAELML